MKGHLSGRANQKLRTRTALLKAAAELLEQGQSPSVGEVADAALVSRATAYRYFPSQEHLLLQAVLDRSIDETDRVVREAIDRHQGAGERVDALVRAVHGEIASNEQRFRDFARLSAQSRAGEQDTVGGVRGDRRIRWIEHALQPLRGRMPEREFERLVRGLSLCIGAESFIVLSDLCRLRPAEVEETERWAVRALLAAAEREAQM
ncbi:TetR/AcrR family transcriptional regulator [Actinomadura fulvescens]|uniref:HTH tetR-type domain-containing protein n=1 Tax=Actinomadura fulvescens TaxID=46160 RepID=A0ABP6CW57_9ACTN